MAKSKLSDTEQVSEHIAKLPEQLQPAVEYLRRAILSIDKTVKEHIKWNSPAFYYSGDMKAFYPKEYKRDILVMHLRNNKIICVLPTGMSIQQNTTILEGDYTDGRRMINFKDLNDIKKKEQQLKLAIREWLSLVEK